MRRHNEWQRGTEANMRRSPKLGRGGATRGGKANHVTTWAEPNTKMGETVRTTRARGDGSRSCKRREHGIGTKLVAWFTVHECKRNKLKLLEEATGVLTVETTLSNCRQICVCYWG
ncbi:hypothetical protein TNCV_1978461 [Trichonephila clavipes]|nr:hypothetical protein TNCV_1978461 [Trichonephila clavipes]